MSTTLSGINAQALLDAQAAAWNSGDPGGIAATYAATGRLVSPDGYVCDGRDVIEAAFVMLFGGPATAGMPPGWARLFADATTEYTVDDVRPLTETLAIVEATQTVGPLPPLHITAVLARSGKAAEILECRAYAFLALP